MVNHRAAGGTARQRRGVLEAAGDASATRAPKCAAERGNCADGDAKFTTSGTSETEDDITDLDLTRRVDERDDARRLDADDGEVTVDISSGDGTGRRLSAGEGHLDIRTVQVVDVRHNQAVRDDDTATAAVHTDHGGTDLRDETSNSCRDFL
jgi:hypothetical protein